MQFEISIWRNTYNRINELGQQVKDSLPDYKGNPPLFPLDRASREELKEEIKVLTLKNSRYMDKCGMRMPRPLWEFSRQDKSTWFSDSAFAYKHLL